MDYHRRLPVAVTSVGRTRISVARAGAAGESVTVIDPAIESHYGTGYERSRLFPGGRPSLEFVRSMELLGRLLPPPPARLLDVGGGPGAYAAASWRARRDTALADRRERPPHRRRDQAVREQDHSAGSARNRWECLCYALLCAGARDRGLAPSWRPIGLRGGVFR